MLRFSLFLGLFFGVAANVLAQNYLGYHSSNMGGLNALSANPANIADSRYRFEMNLLSIDSRLSNNYMGLSTNLFNANSNINPIGDTIYNGAFQLFRGTFFNERDTAKMRQARIFQSLDIQGPSFAFQVGKNSFAITTGVREMFFVDNLDPRTAHFILSELEDPTLWNVNLNNKKFNAVATAWSEFGIAYGREIWSNGEHFIKGGIHLKFLVALANAYFYADELTLNFKNDDTLRVRLSDIRFGYSNNLKDDIVNETFGSAKNFFNKTTAAVDFGVVYEWRPKHKQFLHPKDSSKYVHHKSKYTLKAGFSVHDLGALRFDRGTWAGGFEGITLDWDLDTFAKPLEGIETFGQLMQDSFQMTENRDPYNVRLPAALNFFVDYNIWKGFYVNFSGHVAFNHNNSPKMMHTLNQFTLTPRYEHSWFDIGIPISINGHNNVTVGTNIRLGPLFIGSSDCWNFIIGKNVRGLNVYGGLKIPIPYTKPKDKKEKEPKIKPQPQPEPDTLITRVDIVDTVRTVVTIVDTVKTVVQDTSVADPNPTTDFPDLPIFGMFGDTTKTPNGNSNPSTPEEIAKTKELMRIRKTYKYVPNIFEFDPFTMELAKGSVYFETGKHKIQDEDKPVLVEIAKILKSNPKLRIEIHGHADNVGDNDLNRELSAKRAEAVKKYLLEKGAPAEQIVKIDSFGAERPTADNETEEGRQKNRRVELILASDGGY